MLTTVVAATDGALEASSSNSTMEGMDGSSGYSGSVVSTSVVPQLSAQRSLDLCVRSMANRRVVCECLTMHFAHDRKAFASKWSRERRTELSRHGSFWQRGVNVAEIEEVTALRIAQ
jgi:hypothetical protein